MSAPGAGVLLALSGDDADILRALSQSGSGLCVVRRCADLPELLSAGMAGLASFACWTPASMRSTAPSWIGSHAPA